MWLYVPTSCQSAPGPEDSISASDSPAQILARSVTWNGRHSRSQTWSQRFKRVSWTMLLFGAILPPSTATRSVERWIGLLAASRASRIALPVSDKGPTTNGTCGPTPPESSGKSDPASSFWRTFQESQGITTSASGQSYEEWVTQLRKDYSRRLKSAHRIFGNDSLSWATPTAQPSASQGDAEWNGACYRRPDGSKVSTVLTHQTMNWPTPTTAPEAPNQGSNIKDGGYRTLVEASQELWPTATVSTGAYAYGRGNPETPSLKLDGAARTFPTPNANAQKGFTSTDGKGRASDYKSYSHLPQTTTRPGHDCSLKCRRLNPLFVETLMGWPGGWTLLPTGRTGSESLATGLCRWWRLMRFALSQLGQG